MKRSNSRKLVRAFLKELGGSQREIAQKVGVRQASISRWTQSGFPPLREDSLRLRFPDLKVWQSYPKAREDN